MVEGSSTCVLKSRRIETGVKSDREAGAKTISRGEGVAEERRVISAEMGSGDGVLEVFWVSVLVLLVTSLPF